MDGFWAGVVVGAYFVILVAAAVFAWWNGRAQARMRELLSLLPPEALQEYARRHPLSKKEMRKALEHDEATSWRPYR
jgi:hypothetical protein